MELSIKKFLPSLFLAALRVASVSAAAAGEPAKPVAPSCEEIRDATMAPFERFLAAEDPGQVQASVKSACLANVELASGENRKLEDLHCAKPRILIDRNIRAARTEFDQACGFVVRARAAAADCVNGQAGCLKTPGSLFRQAAEKIKKANSGLEETAKLVTAYAEDSKQRALAHAKGIEDAAQRAACADPRNESKYCLEKGRSGLNSGLDITGHATMTLGQYFARFEGISNPSPDDMKAIAARLESWSPSGSDADPIRDFGKISGEEIRSTQEARSFQALWESSRPKFESLATNVESMGTANGGAGTRLASIVDPAGPGAAPPAQLSPGVASAALRGDLPASGDALVQGLSASGATTRASASGAAASRMIAGIARPAPAQTRGAGNGAGGAALPADSGSTPDLPISAAAQAGSVRSDPGNASAGSPGPVALVPTRLAKPGSAAVVEWESPGTAAEDLAAAPFSGNLSSGAAGYESRVARVERLVRGAKPEAPAVEPVGFAKAARTKNTLADRLRRALAESGGRPAGAGAATVRELFGRGGAFSAGLPNGDNEADGASRLPFSMGEAETERELRRLEDESAGLLGADSAALFRRVHETHQRLLKRGRLGDSVSAERAAAN